MGHYKFKAPRDDISLTRIAQETPDHVPFVAVKISGAPIKVLIRVDAIARLAKHPSVVARLCGANVTCSWGAYVPHTKDAWKYVHTNSSMEDVSGEITTALDILDFPVEVTVHHFK